MYIGNCVFEYHPEYCLFIDGSNGALSRPDKVTGPAIQGDDVFWSTRRTRFEVLHRVADRLRSLPVSTAEVERTFNCLGDILKDTRKGALSEEMLESEIFNRVSSSFNKIFLV